MALSKLQHKQLLNKRQIFSLKYHDIFDYPLTALDLEKWQSRFEFNSQTQKYKNYYFLNSKKNLVSLRLQREENSKQKLIIAKKAAEVLKKIPSIKFIGITGSLAMNNARKDSDIDFLIITSKGLLWTTRLISYLVLNLGGFVIRKPKDKNEKNKLCLNMWLDESDLYFDKHNLFTAHELAAIKPLINKDTTYERLILNNNWIFDYWPNAIRKPNKISKIKKIDKFVLVEYLARQIQWQYMKNKKTRELVTPTRAFFHPFDWGEHVLIKLK